LPDGSLDNPVNIAVAKRSRGESGVSEAVMRFDLSDATFVVFHNATGGGVNVVYQCPNGTISRDDTGSRTVGHTVDVNAVVTD